ncbi:MAG: DUF1343 domain-containing protein [Desulfomonilaceae bacterium]|nr:DUF1343 domain-containing protein [Desulfomonilaceae bacterium]
MVRTGLERILQEPELVKGSGGLGVLYNQASVDSRLRPAPDLIDTALPRRLKALFGPQHGVHCTEQDNMIETGHTVHPRLHVPIFSLYANKREPDPHMLENVDTLLIDLQDVGTRVYTFATTALYAMQICAELGKAVIVLDRPNPINGRDIEGNVLNPQYTSFVGPFPIPMRHGMTLGELMTLYNEVHRIGCALTVIAMQEWDRNAYFEATELPWVMPSPNMPTVETAVVYPGQVVLEGTNLSEGRGTTRPFEIFGAPYVEPERVALEVEPEAITGAVLRPIEFKPTFNKWADRTCKGFQIHVIDRNVFRPYRAALGILAAVARLYPGNFQWSEPPYEYVYDMLPADVILGDGAVRLDVEAGKSLIDMERKWDRDLEEFKKVRSAFLIYPDA